MSKKDTSKIRGVLLIEVLIAIALFLAVSTIIAQALFTSFYGGRLSEEKSIINNLLSEQLSKVRALSTERWDNIGGLSRNQDYYIASSTNKFSVATGTYSGESGGLSYKISFKLEEALRQFDATSTPLSLSSSSSTSKDDSTLIIIGNAIWGNNQSANMKSLITRYRNIVCAQKGWSATGSPSNTPCETENIATSDKTNIETGEQIKLCNGCK